MTSSSTPPPHAHATQSVELRGHTMQVGDTIAIARPRIGGGGTAWSSGTVLHIDANATLVSTNGSFSADGVETGNRYPKAEAYPLDATRAQAVTQEQLRQRILGVIAEATLRFGHIATWNINTALDGGTGIGARVGSDGDVVLRALCAEGLVEEVPDFGERYRLVGTPRL